MSKGKFTRRTFLQMTGLGVSTGLLAACVPVAAPSAEEAAMPEPVTVTFMVPGSTNEDADFAPVFEEFNNRYPEIDGQYTPAGTGYGQAYNDKLLTMLSGGTAPDTFKTLFGYFGSLAEKNVYVPLDDYAAQHPDETVFDDFFDAHVNACIIKGQLLALPNDGAPEGIWYNADLYDAAGLPYPDWDTTWSDMSAAGTALTQVDGSITTHYGIGHPNWLGTIWSNGGEILNEDGTQCMLDSDEAIEALEWMQSLVVDDGSAPGPEALSELGMFDRFTSGTLGSFWCVRGCLGGLRSIEDFQFDAAPLPLSNSGSRLTRLLIGWTSIWSGSEVPDEAYLLAAWICSPEGQRLRISRGYAHPSRKSLVEQDWYKNYECERCNSHAVNNVFPEMLLRGEGRAWPAHPNESEIVQAITTGLDSLWDGSKPAAQLAADLTAEINGIIG
ncbi:MAG: sugar ABC transporter substrate-binding protein [Caldilineaceae bacterium]|nr:sugar ABC transporter substrate-binding protein [Caldilineaceae bacterium]